MLMKLATSTARRGSELTLRVDEECARRHHALAGRQATDDRDGIADAITDHHCAGFEVAMPEIDKDSLSVAGV